MCLRIIKEKLFINEIYWECLKCIPFSFVLNNNLK
nr:MAG TPA: hypothetical protein [Caudoviricetes sp.]